MRLDKYIQTRFGLRSRTYAENLIKTGCVYVDGSAETKPACEINEEEVKIVDDGYATQGAYKLQEAFKVFSLDVQGKLCADIGCSNGGFTDCLLRHGARGVVAIDVAECALPDEILKSGKVIFVRANARELPTDLEKVEFVCSDVSFISLKLLLGEIYKLLKEGGEAVTLVKPQFELDKNALNKSGIVASEKLRLRALKEVRLYAESIGFDVLAEALSPIRFQNKNIEYLLHLKKRNL